MIATLNSDCSILTLEVEALASAAGKTFDSLVLKSRLNCSLTESSVTVSSLIGSIVNKKISIPATLFYGDVTKTKYCDGVYYFQLDVTYTYATGQPVHAGTYLVEDPTCIAVICNLTCRVQEYYIKTKDKSVWYEYYALLQGGACDLCNCADTCASYNELNILLNDNNIVNSDSGCGCS